MEIKSLSDFKENTHPQISQESINWNEKESPFDGISNPIDKTELGEKIISELKKDEPHQKSGNKQRRPDLTRNEIIANLPDTIFDELAKCAKDNDFQNVGIVYSSLETLSQEGLLDVDIYESIVMGMQSSGKSMFTAACINSPVGVNHLEQKDSHGSTTSNPTKFNITRTTGTFSTTITNPKIDKPIVITSRTDVLPNLQKMMNLYFVNGVQHFEKDPTIVTMRDPKTNSNLSIVDMIGEVLDEFQRESIHAIGVETCKEHPDYEKTFILKANTDKKNIAIQNLIRDVSLKSVAENTNNTNIVLSHAMQIKFSHVNDAKNYVDLLWQLTEPFRDALDNTNRNPKTKKREEKIDFQKVRFYFSEIDPNWKSSTFNIALLNATKEEQEKLCQDFVDRNKQINRKLRSVFKNLSLRSGDDILANHVSPNFDPSDWKEAKKFIGNDQFAKELERKQFEGISANIKCVPQLLNEKIDSTIEEIELLKKKIENLNEGKLQFKMIQNFWIVFSHIFKVVMNYKTFIRSANEMEKEYSKLLDNDAFNQHFFVGRSAEKRKKNFEEELKTSKKRSRSLGKIPKDFPFHAENGFYVRPGKKETKNGEVSEEAILLDSHQLKQKNKIVEEEFIRIVVKNEKKHDYPKTGVGCERLGRVRLEIITRFIELREGEIVKNAINFAVNRTDGQGSIDHALNNQLCLVSTNIFLKHIPEYVSHRFCVIPFDIALTIYEFMKTKIPEFSILLQNQKIDRTIKSTIKEYYYTSKQTKLKEKFKEGCEELNTGSIPDFLLRFQESLNSLTIQKSQADVILNTSSNSKFNTQLMLNIFKKTAKATIEDAVVNSAGPFGEGIKTVLKTVTKKGKKKDENVDDPYQEKSAQRYIESVYGSNRLRTNEEMIDFVYDLSSFKDTPDSVHNTENNLSLTKIDINKINYAFKRNFDAIKHSAMLMAYAKLTKEIDQYKQQKEHDETQNLLQIMLLNFLEQSKKGESQEKEAELEKLIIITKNNPGDFRSKGFQQAVDCCLEWINKSENKVIQNQIKEMSNKLNQKEKVFEKLKEYVEDIEYFCANWEKNQNKKELNPTSKKKEIGLDVKALQQKTKREKAERDWNSMMRDF